MTTSTEIKSTTDLLDILATRKEKELSLFFDKIIELRKKWREDPSALNELKYNLALERYSRLQKDTIDITKLERKIEEVHSYIRPA